MQHQIEKQKALKKCREWQATLELLDWHIEFVIVNDQSELPDTTRTGHVEYITQHKKAKILLLPPWKREEVHHTFEQTLIHELLHLALAPFTEQFEVGTLGHTIEEQTVNSLMRAITAIPRDNG